MEGEKGLWEQRGQEGWKTNASSHIWRLINLDGGKGWGKSELCSTQGQRRGGKVCKDKKSKCAFQKKTISQLCMHPWLVAQLKYVGDAWEWVSITTNKTHSTKSSHSPGCNKSSQTGRRFRQRDYMDADVIRNRMIDVFDIMEHVDFMMV